MQKNIQYSCFRRFLPRPQGLIELGLSKKDIVVSGFGVIVGKRVFVYW